MGEYGRIVVDTPDVLIFHVYVDTLDQALEVMKTEQRRSASGSIITLERWDVLDRRYRPTVSWSRSSKGWQRKMASRRRRAV